MSKNPVYFIEVVKTDISTRNLSPYPFHKLKWALDVGKKLGVITIAIFKIYPKNAG